MVARVLRKTNKPTRWPEGLNDQFIPSGMLKNWAMPDPQRYVTWGEDFFRYTVGEWTVTKTGTGTNTLSSTAGGGVLSLVNSAASGDNQFLQPVAGLPFNFTVGKYLAGRMRFQVDDATNAVVTFGLQAVNVTPLTIVNGIVISKPAAVTSFTTTVSAASVQSTTAGLNTLVAATWTEVGFVYDPRHKPAEISFWMNGSIIGTNTVTGIQPLTNAPSVQLTPTFGVQNGTAAARTMLIDSFLFTMERT